MGRWILLRVAYRVEIAAYDAELSGAAASSAACCHAAWSAGTLSATGTKKDDPPHPTDCCGCHWLRIWGLSRDPPAPRIRATSWGGAQKRMELLHHVRHL